MIMIYIAGISVDYTYTTATIAQSNSVQVLSHEFSYQTCQHHALSRWHALIFA